MSVIYIIQRYILLFYGINTLGEVSVGEENYNYVENSIKNLQPTEKISKRFVHWSLILKIKAQKFWVLKLSGIFFSQRKTHIKICQNGNILWLGRFLLTIVKAAQLDAVSLSNDLIILTASYVL